VKVDQDKNNLVTDTKSLSGGERSFSTVALLLSLWYQMDTPFLAMDEFDVFMDVVNRGLSITLLVDFARKYNYRQFIFITPQSTSQITKGDDVKIFSLENPDRGHNN